MAKDDKRDGPRRIRVENVSQGAPIWLIGWLFTIGYCELTLGRALLALLLWPYMLGATMR